MKFFNNIALWFLKIYKNFFSPLLPASCRFYPTCSEYSAESFRKYFFLKALWLTIKRLARCHPLCEGGHDPVP